MKVLQLLILIMFSASCGSNLNKYERKNNSFLEGKSFEFSDSGVRNVTIIFINDSLIKFSNSVSGLQAHNYYRFNYTVKFPIRKLDNFRYIIEKPIKSIDTLFGSEYARPYRRKPMYSRLDIFPNVVGDTVFLNDLLNKLQLKDFNFDIKD